MNEGDSTTFFVEEIARHARTLPLNEAVQFLKGGLQLIGDREEVQALREASIALNAADNQLELISGQQLRLSLERSAS